MYLSCPLVAPAFVHTDAGPAQKCGLQPVYTQNTIHDRLEHVHMKRVEK